MTAESLTADDSGWLPALADKMNGPDIKTPASAISRAI
jgi:hypothetical protein